MTPDQIVAEKLDQFAAAALTGLIAARACSSVEATAELAFDYAFAMLGCRRAIHDTPDTGDEAAPATTGVVASDYTSGRA